MTEPGTASRVRRSLAATRMEDGSVLLTITAYADPSPDTPDAVTTIVMPAEQWCLAIAAASPLGATAHNLSLAKTLHGIAA